MPDSVKVARRPVKPFGVGASPTLAANLSLSARIVQTSLGFAMIGRYAGPNHEARKCTNQHDEEQDDFSKFIDMQEIGEMLVRKDYRPSASDAHQRSCDQADQAKTFLDE